MTEATQPPVEGHVGIRRLINRGAEIAGGVASSAAATATSFLLAGPEATLLGGAVGSSAALALRWLGEEVTSRLLGPREEQRIGYVYSLAASEISERIKRGEQVRQDGFFGDSDSGRSDAAEVWEGILLKCQREPEEMKLPYMAHLLANLAFCTQTSASMAHQITKAAEALTYRQLCIMKLTSIKDKGGLRSDDYRGQGNFSRDLYQVLYEYLDLYNRAFVNFGGEVAFGPIDVKPSAARLQGIGNDVFNLMQLWEIPMEDTAPLAAQLK